MYGCIDGRSNIYPFRKPSNEGSNLNPTMSLVLIVCSGLPESTSLSKTKTKQNICHKYIKDEKLKENTELRLQSFNHRGNKRYINNDF